MIKLMIVEDSSFMTNLIKNMIIKDKEIDVIDTAQTAEEAIKKIKRNRPDCVTMDINLPGMNGIEAVKEIMASEPLPIIMLSAYSDRNSQQTFQALEFGAVDFLQKPGGEISIDIVKEKELLIQKIKTAAKINVKKLKAASKTPADIIIPDKKKIKSLANNLIGIGISTGGPRTLKQILPFFSEKLDYAVIISQHMPANYTKTFARQLNKITKMNTVEAQNLDRIYQGWIYICPGEMNLIVKNKTIFLTEPDDKTIYIPSADIMFESMAKDYKENCLALVMTGMGNDGAKGIKVIKQYNGYVLAQDEKTSIVYGMPRAALETGFTDRKVAAGEIPKEVESWIFKKIK